MKTTVTSVDFGTSKIVTLVAENSGATRCDIVGAGIVTMVELGIGLLCNRDFQVWDYRQQAGNFLGQICPVFTALWIPVSLLALGLHYLLNRRMDCVFLKRCAYLL